MQNLSKFKAFLLKYIHSHDKERLKMQSKTKIKRTIQGRRIDVVCLSAAADFHFLSCPGTAVDQAVGVVFHDGRGLKTQDNYN